MTVLDLIRQLRDVEEIGIVNARHTMRLCGEAADRLEEMDERIAIMEEGNGCHGCRSGRDDEKGRVAPGTCGG